MVMFTFIMRYCLMESNDGERSYQLLLNRICFFNGRFKLTKLGDDVRNSNNRIIAAITDKASQIAIETRGEVGSVV